MTEYSAVKDSGAREEFASGARRDTQDGKPRFGLIPPYPLERLAMHYTNGAKKYGENNWTKGITTSRCWESLERHVQAYKAGDKSEDHLAAVAWNAFAIMWTEKFLPDQDDLSEYMCWPTIAPEFYQPVVLNTRDMTEDEVKAFERDYPASSTLPVESGAPIC